MPISPGTTPSAPENASAETRSAGRHGGSRSATSLSQRGASLLWTPEARILLALLVLTLIRGVVYALLDPSFGAPDERDHFQYIASLATAGATGSRGREGHQPMLYYALVAPAYWLAAGQTTAVRLLAVRMASLPLLLGQVWLAWLSARKLAPARPAVAVLAAGMVALQPQLAYIGGSANNDDVANFVAALLVFLTISMLLEWRWWLPAATIVAVGAAVLSKGQILPMAGLALLPPLGRFPRQLGAGHLKGLLLALPALLLAVVATRTWESSMLLERTQYLITTLQRWPQALEGIRNYGRTPYEYAFVSFWGAFLGESVRPFGAAYLLPAVVVVLGLAGLVAGGITGRGRGQGRSGRSVIAHGFLLLVIPMQIAVVYLLFVQSVLDPKFPWTLQYMQGRYMFPALLPLALLVAEGWDSWVRLTRRPVLTAVPIVALACFDLLSAVALANFYSWIPAG